MKIRLERMNNPLPAAGRGEKIASYFLACLLLLLALPTLAQERSGRPQINLAERFPALNGFFSPRPTNEVYEKSQRSLGIQQLDDLVVEGDGLAPPPKALPGTNPATPPAPPGIPISQFQPSVPVNRIHSSPNSLSPVPPLDPSQSFRQPMPFDDVYDPLADPLAEPMMGPPSQRLTTFRNGFFQKLSVQATYIADNGDMDGLGFTELETYLTVAVPFPIVEWPLLITPYAQMRLLAGPHNTDLPPRLYDTFVEFMWVPQIFQRWLFIIVATPSVYSDFESNSPDGFRVTGKGIVRYDLAPDRLQLIAGVLYLNREDLNLLPVGGAIWTPNDFSRYELIFPKPKLAQRFNVGMGFEDWVYVTAEYGGNTYAITRATNTPDYVTWTDYRVLLGIERRLNGGAGFHVEGGYVFGREVDFESNVGDFTPPNTWLARGGIVF